MRAAVVSGGVVENIIIAGPDFDPGEGRIIVELDDLSEAAIGWSYDGNVFTPASLSQPVPRAVTARQARLALLGAGVLSAIEQALASMPGVQGDAARIEWEYATEIQRDSALIEAIAPMLGLTEGQIDNLFRAAVGL